MLVYPDFETLKRLYPTVGVRVLKPAFQNEGTLLGNMLIGNQVHSEYKFKGADFQDLYHNILRSQHFIEQRNPKCLLQSVPAAVAAASEDADETGTSRVWVISDDLVERYRVLPNEVQGYLDRGFVVGRKKFAAWVEAARIEAFSAKVKQKQIDKLKALAKPAAVPGVDLRKGARLLVNTKTGERKRFPAHVIEQQLANGWKPSDLTAQRLAKVNVGVGRGAHFKNRRWVINIETRQKQCLPPEDAQRLISTGKFAAAGARTR